MSDCLLQLFTNNAVALLDTNISNTDLTIQVQAGLGSLFPQPAVPGEWFVVTLEDAAAPLTREIVKIIGRTGDVLTVDPAGRGYEGSTAQAWTVGNVIVDHRVTAGTLRCFQEQAVPLPHNIETGTVINTSTTEIANSMDTTGPNKTCKWLVTVQTADGRITITEVLAVYKAPPDSPIWTEYARVGDKILFDIDVISTASNMILEVTNNDISVLTEVNVIRLQHF